MKTFLLSCATLVAGLTVAGVGFVLAEKDNDTPAASAHRPVPVDDDMHHLMEYVFEPAYKRLKLSMAEAPSEKKQWKAIKGDALTLAEATNLLLHRVPEEGDAASWLDFAIESRQAGGKLYQAARAADYGKAKQDYEAMLNRCNACHDKFADGEHQLEP